MRLVNHASVGQRSPMDAFTAFIMDSMLKHPSVQDCKSSFVLQRWKGTTAVPV